MITNSAKKKYILLYKVKSEWKAAIIEQLLNCKRCMLVFVQLSGFSGFASLRTVFSCSHLPLESRRQGLGLFVQVVLQLQSVHHTDKSQNNHHWTITTENLFVSTRSLGNKFLSIYSGGVFYFKSTASVWIPVIIYSYAECSQHKISSLTG